MDFPTIVKDDFLFTGGGNGSVSSEVFVRSIRRWALVKVWKEADGDRYTALVVASYLGGAAMAWYEDLPDDTKESWRLLSKALMKRWPPTGTAILPTPAATTTVPFGGAAKPFSVVTPSTDTRPPTTGPLFMGFGSTSVKKD